MPALDKSIKKLRQLAPVLNKTTDDAARVVQEVENLLSKDLGLGIDESVVIHSYNVSKVKEQITSLAYRRVAGKFRIAVVVEECTEFADSNNLAWNEVEVTPWLECPRDMKLTSFPKLPDLLEALVKKAEETAERVAKAQEAVEGLLGEVKS